MIDLRHFHPIGYVHSAQGLKGDVFVALKALDPSWFELWEELIITARVDGLDPTENRQNLSPIKYVIHELRTHKKQNKMGVILSLENVGDMTQAEQLIGHTVWIPEEFLQSAPGENIFLKEIEGFVVVDNHRGDVGPIVGFSSNGPQDLIEVLYKGTTHFVPLIKVFIERIDKKNKKIFMNIPEGLLES